MRDGGHHASKGSVRDALQVRSSAAVDLADYPSEDTSLAPGKRAATDEAAGKTAPVLAELQEKLYAEAAEGGTRSILLVLQGMDTSGKGGVIDHVAGAFGPAGVRVTSFKKPTDEEKAHDFLWRIWKAVPAPGLIGIFDRSHYEDVLIHKVHGWADQPELNRRYAAINDFESQLSAAGTTVVKCYLRISYETQYERLMARLDDPSKHWKFREGDIDERAHWADYEIAYRDALQQCSTALAPWYVVPSDKKWFRNWAIGEILRETLEELNPQYPEMNLDIAALRARLDATR